MVKKLPNGTSYLYMQKNNNVITFTGNRNVSYKNPEVTKTLIKLQKLYPDYTWRTGMAVGLDITVARFANTHAIPFEAHLPFPAHIQCKYWSDADKQLHKVLCDRAQDTIVYSDKFYTKAYQKRNEKMINGAKFVVAFNLRTRGGTVNAINYALSQKIPVYDGFDDLKEIT